jgi:hypothetical protein
MSSERLSVLDVAANASIRWAGEAILRHTFRGLPKAGHDAWMCVGNETKPELEELLAPMRSESLASKMPRCIRIFRMVENGVVPELRARGLAEGVAESTPVDGAFEIIFIGRLDDGRGPSGSSRQQPARASR